VIVVEITLIVAAVLLLAAALYYGVFAAWALLRPPTPPRERQPQTRFCVLIPAHDEEASIQHTIAAAQAFDYPAELFRVLVLADNCVDRTTQVAREAGADVIERVAPDEPGKGQAMAWALEHHINADEALLVCDADSRPDPKYLRWMDRAFGEGAGAAQGFNGSANAAASSLAALAAVTSGMKNGLHYAGKAAAGLPVPLMNGLVLSAATIAAHPWRAFSITEDFEHYLRLVDAGVTVRFVPEAKILSPRATGFAAAGRQKRRWSGGQTSLARELAWPMACRAVAGGALYKLAAALDLLMPGYSPLTALLVVVAAAAGYLFGIAHAGFLLAAAGLAVMALQFAIGLARLEWTPQLAMAVALAPFYIVWKIALALKSALFKPDRWQRASRD